MPAVANGFVYVGSNDGNFYQLNASNVSQKIANYTTGGSIYSSAAVANGFVYFGSDDTLLYQLNASNISQQVANYTTGGIIYSSAAVANGSVYIGSFDWKLYQFMPDASPSGAESAISISSPTKKCANECLTGERQCAGDSTYKICGDYDLDSCRDWSDTKYCTDGKLCFDGTCKISCNEKWACGEWGACENEKKARMCEDSNNCGTSTSKPDESLDCLGKAGPSAASTGSLLLFLTIGIIILAVIIFIAQSSKNMEIKRKKKRALAYRIR